jgi:nitroreductase
MTNTTAKTTITGAQLAAALNWRYATKKFDPAKKIPADTWAALEQSLVLAPSSFGLQPWKFFVVGNPELRASLCAAAHNQSQVRDASHFVVFAGLRNIDTKFVDTHVARTAQVRGVPRESLDGFRQMMVRSIEGAPDRAAVAAYNAFQSFIALGMFTASAALLGVDTCVMGGFDRAQFDEILGLKGTPYSSMVTCAAGYRAADDKYASLPKVRFDAKDVVIHC